VAYPDLQVISRGPTKCLAEPWWTVELAAGAGGATPHSIPQGVILIKSEAWRDSVDISRLTKIVFSHEWYMLGIIRIASIGTEKIIIYTLVVDFCIARSKCPYMLPLPYSTMSKADASYIKLINVITAKSVKSISKSILICLYSSTHLAIFPTNIEDSRITAISSVFTASTRPDRDGRVTAQN